MDWVERVPTHGLNLSNLSLGPKQGAPGAFLKLAFPDVGQKEKREE